jgi:ferredoxin-NADP reductase
MRAPIRTVAAVVREIEAAGAGVVRIVLADPDDWDLPPFKPGAHIDLHLPGGVVRTYSLCSDPIESRRYVIAVKREDGGRGGSKFLCDRLRSGDRIGVSLPRGGIDLGGQDVEHVFVAGGIGVTPFLSAALALHRQGGRRFRLHVASRGMPPLSQFLQPLVRSGHAVLHDTTRGPRPDIGRLIGRSRPDAMIACCGPEGLIEAFEAAAGAWQRDQVHIERFVPPALAPDPQARPFTLVLAQSGKELDVAPGETILAALRRTNVEVDASCEGGICGACRVRWIEGPPVHRDRVLSDRERETHVMVCVAGCAGPRLVLDI